MVLHRCRVLKLICSCHDRSGPPVLRHCCLSHVNWEGKGLFLKWNWQASSRSHRSLSCRYLTYIPLLRWWSIDWEQPPCPWLLQPLLLLLLDYFWNDSHRVDVWDLGGGTRGGQEQAMVGHDGLIDSGVDDRKRRRKRESERADCERKKREGDSLVHHN